MKVKELMRTHNVLSVRADDDVAMAAQLFGWGGVRHLPVLEKGRVVGVFSERDLLRYRAETGGHGGLEPVRRFMSAPAVVVEPDDEIDQAMGLMIAGKRGCLPVVEGARLVGILTTTDVVGRVFVKARSARSTPPVTVRDAMTPAPVTVRPGDPILEAVGQMVDHHIRHLPVVDDRGRLVGILSDRDLRTAIGDPLEALREESAGLDAMSVSSVMTRDPVTARPDAPLEEIARRFVDERVGAIPVLGPDHRLVGIVSYVDVIRASRPIADARAAAR
jgi:CBS domain-containing protein